MLFATRGDVAAGAGYSEQALVIRASLAPDSFVLAESYNDLGLAERTRGNLDRSAELQRQALAIREGIAPRSLDVAASHLNIGLVQHD